MQVRMPGPGQEVKIYDYPLQRALSADTLVAVDKGKTKTPLRAKALPLPKVPLPDLKTAKRLEYLLQVSAGPTIVSPALPADDPLSKALVNSLCVGSTTHWAISRDSWRRAMPCACRRRSPPWPMAPAMSCR